MTTDHLVTILTLAVVPIFLALLKFAETRMKRADERRASDEAESREALQRLEDKLNDFEVAYAELRERFTELKHRSIRRFYAALDRAEQERNEDACRILRDAISEFESIELPLPPSRVKR